MKTRPEKKVEQSLSHVTRFAQEEKLAAAPEEIYLNQFRFLSPIEWQVMTGVSQQFYRVTRETYLWENYIEEHDLPVYRGTRLAAAENTPSEMEVSLKEQVIAHFLYNNGVTSIRADFKHYYFSQTLDYLAPRQDQVWTSYYFGMIYYHGHGVEMDRERGLTTLASVAEQDYRAAQFLIRGVNSAITRKSAEFKSAIGLEKQAKLLPTLELAAEERGDRVKDLLAKDMAYVYRKLDAKKHLAQALLLRAVEKNEDVDAAVSLFQLGEEKKDLLKVIRGFEALYERKPLAKFAYKIAVLQIEYLRHHPGPQEAKASAESFERLPQPTSTTIQQWLGQALEQGSGDAAQELADWDLNSKEKDLTKIKSLYQLAFKLGATDSLRILAKLIALKRLPGTKAEIHDFYKRGFLAGDTTSVQLLSDIYLKDASWRTDPAKIWWIQAAAFCGCRKSRLALEFEKENGFANCASALVHSLNVGGPVRSRLFTQHMLGEPRTPETLLNKINRMAPGEILHYRAIGEQEGLLERPLRLLLDQWIENAKPKTSLSLSKPTQ